MKAQKAIKINLVAPCGMNCALCMAYQRDKNQCEGCRAADDTKPKSCVACVVVNCPIRLENGWKYCPPDCPEYPCRRLKALDMRYTAKYMMSMLDNLRMIDESGIRAFVRYEKSRWECPDCGGVICVHRHNCSDCGAEMKAV
ncbi:MAG: DUF3795 domain-containing protein [Candidatus Kapaibacterium sp.]